VYHLFVVRSTGRAALQRHLSAHGIDTLVHNPAPVTHQRAFANLRSDGCPQAVAACDEVLSLPLHPGLDAEDVARVVAAINEFSGG
jgi:dTDP-4-amino-4,6-dideoxygalactose transaminase